MRILHGYVGRVFLLNWWTANLVLAGLVAFLDLARELDDIGEGSYGFSQALLHVLLRIPGHMFELAPTSAFLGGIGAIGLLSQHQEILALRACGISVLSIGWSILVSSVPVLLVSILCGQFLIPPLEQTAWISRVTALSPWGTFLPEEGFWTRGHGVFVNLYRDARMGKDVVDMYYLDASENVTRYITAVVSVTDDQWRLTDTRDVYVGKPVAAATGEMEPARLLDQLLTPGQAEELSLPAETLSFSELVDSIRLLHKKGQNAGRYELALWKMLAMPVWTAGMLLFSLIFSIGFSRGLRYSHRIMAGSVLGIGLYYANQIGGYAGLIHGIPAAWTTLFPGFLLLVVSLWWIRRKG